MKHRWIFKRTTKYKGKRYDHFTVVIRGKYRFSSKQLENCIDYVKWFAKANNIPEERLGGNTNSPINYIEL